MKSRFLQMDIKPFVLFVFAIAIIFAFTVPKNNLIGKWSILNLDGTQAGEYIDFKKDSTYSIVLPNGEIGEKGIYILNDTMFSLKNMKNSCGKDYWGKYGLTFHGDDSVHFSFIEDTCAERKTDIVGYNPGLKRYKQK